MWSMPGKALRAAASADFSRFTDEQIDEMFEAVMDHFDGFYKHGYYHGESIIDFRDLAKRSAA